MISLSSFSAQKISGGITIQDKGNGLYRIETSNIDILHKPTIVQREIVYITDNGMPIYGNVNVPNPQYRGQLQTTNSDYFWGGLSISACVTAALVLFFFKK